jgi:hypothetical protein
VAKEVLSEVRVPERVAELVKKFLTSVENPKDHYYVHKSLSLGPVFSQKNPEYTLLPLFLY